MKKILGIFLFILFITSNYCFPVLDENIDASKLIALAIKRSSSKEEVLSNLCNYAQAFLRGGSNQIKVARFIVGYIVNELPKQMPLSYVQILFEACKTIFKDGNPEYLENYKDDCCKQRNVRCLLCNFLHEMEQNDFSIDDANADNTNMLNFAIDENNLELIRLLFAHGADVNIHRQKSDCLFGVQFQESPILNAMENKKDLEIVVELITHGSEHVFSKTELCSPLIEAVKIGNIKMVELLLDKNIDIDLCDKEGETALHWAAYNGKEDILRLLIEYGADLNLQDQAGYTALMRAMQQKNFEISKFLLNIGARVDLQNKEEESVLHIAAREDRLEEIKIILDNGADINLKSIYGDTPLHWSASKNSLLGVTMLLNSGSKVDVRNKRGESPLDIKADRKIRKLLLQYKRRQAKYKGFSGFIHKTWNTIFS